MSKHLSVVLGLVLVLGACGGEQSPEAGAPVPAGVEQATPYSKPMLPVFETAGEQKLGKADWYDDYRNANLDVYGITEPPAVAHRPMAEWETAESLIMVYSSSTLPAGIKNNFVDIIDYAKDVVDVHVIYDSSQAYNSLANLLAQNGISATAVTWVNMDNDSIWARDFGPISIFSGTKVGINDARYYHQRYNDDAIPTLLVGEDWGLTTYHIPLDMEGGNFMATEDAYCATSQGMYWYNGTSQANVNSYMEDYFGCQDLLVVQPPDGEGTTHIDMQAKFLTDDTVVVGQYTNAQDPANKQILDANAALFQAAGFNVQRIPMPNNNDGVFRSYTNSLLVNGVHIVPVYSGYSSMQAEAMAVYESILPGWDHVPSNSDAVIQWSGAIHCITKLVAAGQWTPLEADPDVICDSYDCYPGGGTPTGCGDVTFEGCCDGNLLQYCENNTLTQQMCNPGTCGWDGQGGYYNCGTNGSSDPSGDNPKDCDGGCTPDCAGAECGGDGCGGSCGTCTGAETCQNGQCVAPCTPNCTNKECGGDGCGGVCGTCPAGQTCEAGLCAAIPSECGDITFEGCCDGNQLLWCEDGAIQSFNCQGGSCGWDAQDGYYNCGTNGAADPSGQHPKDCDDLGCQADCTDKECGGDGCGGVCGLCGPGETCTGGACVADCVSDCAGKNCGPDGCGGSCGTCGAGDICEAGLCTTPPDPCGDVDYVGCCDGEVLYWCESDAIESLTCDSCGWDADLGFYNCGFTGEDPSGDHPKACDGSCLPVCDGIECGDDGCGGSCGACAPGEACSADGLCVAGDECGDVTYAGYCDGNTLVWCEDGKLYSADCAFYGSYICDWVADNQGYYCVYQSPCEPDCVGKACGDDGCGGSCGACPPDMSCDGGICIEEPCEADCAGKQCGDDGCGALCGVCGDGFHCEQFNCVQDCVSDCAGKDCGADGCGGSCGACGDGLNCVAGLCTEGPCEPDCTDKVCGSDGCDGACGLCGDGETCEDGSCVDVCLPECTGKECGPDGCSGSCGNCAGGFSCEDGLCVAGCTPDCDAVECGDDGCGGSCGTCDAGLSCQDGLCTDVCVPACDGKQCGPDGCGDTCGDCPKDWTCDEDAGACVQDPTNDCGNIPSTGVCLAGNVLAVCVANEVVETDCSVAAEICAFVPEEGRYDCVPLCEADCTGKTCGDDGCGGSCGACPKGQSCEAGVCEDLTCLPACIDKDCGDDGCGGSCGTCGADELCAAGVCIDDGAGCPDGTTLVDGACVPDGGDDVIGGGDAGVDVGGKVSSGCAVGDRGQPGVAWLAFAFLVLFGVLRPRRAAVSTRR
jgi:agmatine/peptidylarginine deiminase